MVWGEQVLFRVAPCSGVRWTCFDWLKTKCSSELASPLTSTHLLEGHYCNRCGKLLCLVPATGWHAGLGIARFFLCNKVKRKTGRLSLCDQKKVTSTSIMTTTFPAALKGAMLIWMLYLVYCLSFNLTWDRGKMLQNISSKCNMGKTASWPCTVSADNRTYLPDRMAEV